MKPAQPTGGTGKVNPLGDKQGVSGSPAPQAPKPTAGEKTYGSGR